jgi:hypothetical protein
MHQEIAHGVLEVSPDLEEKVQANIRPVSVDGHQFEYLPDLSLFDAYVVMAIKIYNYLI